MNIETHTTDRRALAQQISELLGEPVMYAGAPSFAYRVGNTAIDRNGNLEVPDDVLETLKPFLIEQGWLKAEPIPETDERPEEITADELAISFPVEGITVTALKNLTFMLYTRQNLINHMTGENRLWISDLLVNRLREYTPETPEAFTELLDDCRAMGELEGFDFREGTVTLSFPLDETQPEKWTAYAGLTHRMIHAAQEATHVMPKRIETDNEKYAMRSWLMRLGYGGPDLKAERRILLAGLQGYAAFKTSDGMARHREKYAALRQAQREMETSGRSEEECSDDAQ